MASKTAETSKWKKNKRQKISAPARSPSAPRRLKLQVHLIPKDLGRIQFRQGDPIYVRPKVHVEQINNNDSNRNASGAACSCFGFFEKNYDDDASCASSSNKKVWVILDNGTRKLVPRHRLFPVFPNNPRLQDDNDNNNNKNEDDDKNTLDAECAVSVIIVADTFGFRQSAWSQLQKSPHDIHHVLEIGCSTGETSKTIWRQASSWIGFDTSSYMIQQVEDKIKQQQQKSSSSSPSNQQVHSSSRAGSYRTTTSSMHCERLDALVDPLRARQAACQEFNDMKGPTDAFVDIGGNRAESAVWKMWHFLCCGGDTGTLSASSSSSFSALRQIIIKSKELHGSLWKELQLVEENNKGSAILLPQLTLEHDEEWLLKKVSSLGNNASVISGQILKIPSHPRKAPMRLSPKDGKTPICRYHNYHANGCSKLKDDECPFDHVHCHLCSEKGHIASQCPLFQNAVET